MMKNYEDAYKASTVYIHMQKGILRYSNGIERKLTPEEFDMYNKLPIDSDGDFVTDLNILKGMLENGRSNHDDKL